MVKGCIGQMLSMKRFSVKPLTLWSIRGHDVLLNTTHDFLKSRVDSSGIHNWEPNGSHTLKV